MSRSVHTEPRRTTLALLAAATAVAGATAVTACRDASAPGANMASSQAPMPPSATTTTGTSVSAATATRARLDEALRALEPTRAALAAKFREGTARERASVRRRARTALERALMDVVLPRWDGTDWAFEGTSTTPGSGAIACGYFVSTTLLEAGLHVERAKLAQQASENIIKTLVPPADIARFSNVPVEDFVAAVAKRGDGLYIVGLDNHVGFLVVSAGEVLFHHSSYVGTAQVVREPAASSIPIVGSHYRVIGKLFTDAALLDAWLEATPIRTYARGT